MKIHLLYKTIIVCWLAMLVSTEVWAQKINTDSLVSVIVNDYKNDVLHEIILQKALLGKRLAPNYLDFHLFAGRMHQLLKNKDSARYYYHYVIERNPKYADVYPYWIDLELQDGQYDKAREIVELGLANDKNNTALLFKKAEVMQVQAQDEEELQYLYTLQHNYGNNSYLKQRLNYLEGKINQQRLGIEYSNTTFDRNYVGPWNMINVSYSTTRKWGTALGRVSYLDRRGMDQIVLQGTQYEADIYLNTYKNQYFNFNIALSNDVVFPKIRWGGNYYFSFLKSWESNLGLRYTQTSSEDFAALVVGLGKYYGNFWLKGDFYLQKNDNNLYTSYLFTSRYYYGNRHDFGSLHLGIGTSPDDKNTIGLLQNRIALQSLRAGLGLQKMLHEKYIVGLLTSLNYQENIKKIHQSEFEITVRLQYVF